MRSLSVVVLLAFALACNKETADPEVPLTARIIAQTNNTFQPPNARIQRGGTITWEFQSVGHTVIFDNTQGAPADIQPAITSATEARTFANAGVYPYHCDIHPQMTGTITVVVP